MNNKKINFLIKRALKEDIGKKDITTESLVPDNLRVRAKIIAKENGIIAGLKVAKRIFEIQNTEDRKLKMGNKEKKKVIFQTKVNDGEKIGKGKVIAEIIGPARTILTAERVALNFLAHLSGIATLTRKYVEAVAQSPKSKVQSPRIYDTRKTTPLWRELEKYAVRCGGGYNHRMKLDEQILIKDNHIRAVRELGSEEVRKLRKKTPKKIEIEMEAENLKQVKEALAAGVDIIMLDNMSLAQLKKAVELIHRSLRLELRARAPCTVHRKRPLIEISGGVNLKNVRKIAQLGVERISIGAITHSAPALNISLSVDHDLSGNT